MAARAGIKMSPMNGVFSCPFGLKGSVARDVSVLAGAPGIGFMGSCGVRCMV